MPHVLELHEVSKRYRRRAVLDGLNLALARGEIVGLLGPNGSGKTTTLRIASGYLWPDAGSVTVDGADFTPETSALRTRVGYCPERVPLYDPFTVARYLEFVAAARGLGRDTRAAAVRQVLAAFDLQGVARRIIGQLSKGYRQRVGLAQALLGEPDVLLLDEPTNGLDPVQIVEARDMIRSSAAGRGVVISTHILPEAAALCTRIVFLRQGRLFELDGDPSADTTLEVVVRGVSCESLRDLVLACDPGIRVIASDGIADGVVHVCATVPDDPALRGRLARTLAGAGDLLQFHAPESRLDTALERAVLDASRQG